MFQLQLFFLLHSDEWDRVVALPRHKFVTGATLLQLVITQKPAILPYVLSIDMAAMMVGRQGHRT
jgi:hypothetical protein